MNRDKPRGDSRLGCPGRAQLAGPSSRPPAITQFSC
jgi:hypothetical protein